MDRKKPQVPPLRYAPVGMTILFGYQHPSAQTNLSSRPERSVVEGPAVSFLCSGQQHHSVRKAWTGLIEAARCAGITLARSAQNPSAAMEPASTTGSQLFTW
jgi:hypothetical protein